MKYISLLFLTFCLVLSSCKKEAGVGGMAAIYGKVKVKNVSSGGTVLNEYYLPEERVYLIYGNSSVYNDDFRTNYDGAFRFDYLNEGHYTLYAYSYCDTCQSGKKPIFVECDITSHNQLVELPDIIIQKP
jgi:hypothetical protein